MKRHRPHSIVRAAGLVLWLATSLASASGADAVFLAKIGDTPAAEIAIRVVPDGTLVAAVFQLDGTLVCGPSPVLLFGRQVGLFDCGLGREVRIQREDDGTLTWRVDPSGVGGTLCRVR